MWIRILKSYYGEKGCFSKGEIRDIPDEMAALLPEDIYKKTNAPWSSKMHLKKLKAAANAKQIRTPRDKQVRPGKTSGYRTKKITPGDHLN